MAVSRAALVALLVGLTLLVSPALLLQFQEPKECANALDPVAESEMSVSVDATFQYAELSPEAKHAFDRARATDGSVTVSGEQCPEEFSYTPDRKRYEIVEDGSRYVLTTYANDIVPEVKIATGVLAYLGVVLLGIGLVTRDRSGARFPGWMGVVGLSSFVVVTGAVVLDQHVWAAMGWTAIVTAVAFVGVGAAVRPRRALPFGGALGLLPAVVFLPLTGVSVVFLGPAVLPLVLVGTGIGGRKLTALARGG